MCCTMLERQENRSRFRKKKEKRAKVKNHRDALSDISSYRVFGLVNF